MLLLARYPPLLLSDVIALRSLRNTWLALTSRRTTLVCAHNQEVNDKQNAAICSSSESMLAITATAVLNFVL